MSWSHRRVIFRLSGLDAALYEHVKQGWVALLTKETESLELTPGYIDATRQAVANPPSLNSDGLVDNFVAGRAFPLEPDPNDPAALAMAMIEVTDDPDLRARMIDEGRKRVTRFSWTRSARALLDELERAASCESR